jgi:arylformamidase
MGRWIDVSMVIKDGLRTNTSRPGEEVQLTYDVRPEDNTEKPKTIRRINARLHVATHVDAPEHMVQGGKRLDEFPVDTFAGRAVVVDMYHKVPGGIITSADLEDAASDDLHPGDILILRTGWNEHYAEPNFFDDSPYFDPPAAAWCIDQALKMVVVDFLCDPPDAARQTEGPDAFKRAVLTGNVLVVTNADNLNEISARTVTFYAFPLRIVPSEASLARAVVWEN